MHVGLTGGRLFTFRSSLLFFGLIFLFHPAMITVILTDETLLASFSTLAAPVETLLATRKAVTTLPSEICGDAPRSAAANRRRIKPLSFTLHSDRFEGGGKQPPAQAGTKS